MSNPPHTGKHGRLFHGMTPGTAPENKRDETRRRAVRRDSLSHCTALRDGAPPPSHAALPKALLSGAGATRSPLPRDKIGAAQPPEPSGPRDAAVRDAAPLTAMLPPGAPCLMGVERCAPPHVRNVRRRRGRFGPYHCGEVGAARREPRAERRDAAPYRKVPRENANKNNAGSSRPPAAGRPPAPRPIWRAAARGPFKSPPKHGAPWFTCAPGPSHWSPADLRDGRLAVAIGRSRGGAAVWLARGGRVPPPMRPAGCAAASGTSGTRPRRGEGTGQQPPRAGCDAGRAVGAAERRHHAHR